MHKALRIGKMEKHRVDFTVNWFLGLCSISVDGKAILRRPIFLSFEHSFELGSEERHLISIRYNIADYFLKGFHATVDGQKVTPDQEIQEGEIRIETPADDAAAALLFVAFINIVFSVIGTLFVPLLDSLEVRLMLLLGALIYLLFAVKTICGQKSGLILGTSVFLADSGHSLFYEFSWGGLFVRMIILYYLITGLYYWRLTEASRKGASPV